MSSGNAYMCASTMFGTRQKQFGMRVFLEAQEINFLGPLKVNMNIVYFYMNFIIFHFPKKFFPLLTMQAFFRNILQHHTPSNPSEILYWFLLVDNITMQIILTVIY